MQKKKKGKEWMEYIYFQNGYAYATNAILLIKVELGSVFLELSDEDVQLLNGKCIHREYFANLLKEKSIEITQAGFLINGSTIYFSKQQHMFGKTTVPERCDEILNAEQKQENCNTIGINSEELYLLGKALGSAKLEMHINAATAKIDVRPCNAFYYECEAVIMPLML